MALLEGKYHQEGENVDFTPVAACLNGDMVQLPNGLAAIVQSDVAAGVLGAARITGIVRLPKKSTITLLPGGDAYWDVSAKVVNFRPDAGTNDFFLGKVAAYAVLADTYCYVALNEHANYIIDSQGAFQEWTNAITGAGTLALYPGNVIKANVIATSEAEAVTVMSKRTVLPTHKPILEARINRIASSDSTVDIDIALASGVSTTDFEAVVAFAAVHLDGGDNVIDYHSDDGTTDRAPTTTTISDVTATPFEVWIDFADTANVLMYIDGVLVDSSAAKMILTAALTTALAAVISIEKTTGTATGEVQVAVRVRHQAE